VRRLVGGFGNTSTGPPPHTPQQPTHIPGYSLCYVLGPDGTNTIVCEAMHTKHPNKISKTSYFAVNKRDKSLEP
jgi:hypothetical protein